MLTLLAMEVEHDAVIDWTRQELYNPARNASRYLGSQLYRRLHIVGSGEALQTGVKGVSRYVDRKNATWKAVLAWASEQTDIGAIDQAFLYLARRVADTARSLPDLPSLDTPKLTFASVFALFDDLLSKPSRGAQEQLFFAALLDAWRQQLGEQGVVETKHVSASDAAAGTAADVQERYRGQVTEAYEITAGPWTSKLRRAAETLHRHDLSRVHIVAREVARATGEEISAAVPRGLDVTVLDVREEVRSLVARLSKPFRRYALEQAYAFLVDKQPDDELVGAFVAALQEDGLTEPQ